MGGSRDGKRNRSRPARREAPVRTGFRSPPRVIAWRRYRILGAATNRIDRGQARYLPLGMELRRSMIAAVDFEFVIGSALCAHFNSHFCDRISLRVISASQTLFTIVV